MKIYAIQVLTGKEDLFEKNAIDVLKDIQSNCEVINIKRQMFITKKAKKSIQMAPLFPSYVFIKSDDFLDKKTISLLLNVPFFIHFLLDNKNIQPLSMSNQNIVLHFTKIGKVIGSSTVFFDENDRIVVKEGPLKNLEGNIIKVDKRKQRAKILLNFEHNQVKVDLSFNVIQSTNNK